MKTPASQKPHGTRTRYVSGCRCNECRKANSAYYHVLQARAKELAQEIIPVVAPAPQVWTLPDGTKGVRTYKRKCPGVFGEPCSSHLRKDSRGGVCSRCRGKLVGKLLPTTRVLEHLAKLSRLGVGYKTVADAASLSRTTLRKMMTGDRKLVRANTERRILAVDETCHADHGMVPARETWKLIRKMLAGKYMTKGELSHRLGFDRYGMPQFAKRKVLAKTAHAVKKLYEEVLKEKAEIAAMPEYCNRCGEEHTPEARRAFLLKRLPMGVAELKSRRPCWWEGHAGDRSLYRDLHDLHAQDVGGIWHLPAESNANSA